MKTASRHCEVPEPQEDPLVGKGKSEPLRPFRSRQEYRVYPITTVYVPTERQEMARMWLPTWTSATHAMINLPTKFEVPNFTRYEI